MSDKLRALCDHHGIFLEEHVSLSKRTTFRIGGYADFLAHVETESVARLLFRFCREEHFPYFILGRGSNVLASDEGYHGLILHLDFLFQQTKFPDEADGDSCRMVIGAGTTLAKAAKTAMEHGLTGMEGLSGIPGTVGGALYMNAGAYGYEMSQIVESCDYMDENGEVHTLQADALELSYRHSWFAEHPGMILKVTVKLERGDQDEIAAKMQDFLKRRNDKQPLDYPSAGSTFKRPEGNYASALIDQCGLKGYTVGGAQVSEKHAGFVVNLGAATCADVLQLCSDVRRIVQEKTGYVLELEPILLGSQSGDGLKCN
ncbi:MAG: UDP-N-acetylmuramate dehydrogenase [Oscillospiraceae bacterium]|nr:UDP-N-acetylmuramate dehydrogenase [Oscillospiraceae bacterium]